MSKKCTGCGAIMQFDDEKKPGFIEFENLDNSNVCKRCFRIKNYGDYQIVSKSHDDYKKIFDTIKIKRDLVLFLCDIFSLDETINRINDFNGKAILVITKVDLLPKSVKQSKLKKYIENNYKIMFIDIIFVSATKNYNLDLLYNKINKYKTSQTVYLVGNTNSGKSTLINKMTKSYSNFNSDITISSLPATTLDLIKIKINNELTLVDTPGLVNDDNFLTNLAAIDVKKISSNTEIKPKTYQMKPNQSLLIEDYARIDYISDHNNSMTLYLSNNIKVNRISLNTNDKLKNLYKSHFDLEPGMDVVISGLLFCKIVSDANVNIYARENVKVFKRNNLI